MKIGIVIRCCRMTGSSRYVSEIIPTVLKNGHEVHIFTNNWDPLDPRTKIHKIPTISNNFYFCEASFNAFATLFTKFHKMDVCMAQPTRYFTPDVAYMQFVYKEWANYKRNMHLPITFADRVLYWIENRNIRKVKKIIAMSNVIKDEIIKNYNIPEEKIKVIYSGVDLKQFNPNNKKIYRSEIRKQYNISNDDIVLFFLGNPFVRKGLEYAVRSLPLINEKNVKLLIVGITHPDDPIEKYQRIANEIGVGDKIIFAGKRPDAYKYFAASDIFIFPTIYEPFALVIPEAMATGLAPVVSRIAGAAELIEDGKEGLLLNDPKNPKEIAEKINYLIDNNIIVNFGKNARKKAEKYTWEKTADEMLEVFEEVKK